MNFPLPENRIANYAKVSTFLPHLVCQCCRSLSLQYKLLNQLFIQQLICLKCHENFCFKCIPYADDQIPEPIEITVQTILINKNTKYVQDINYRGFCPNCEVMTVLTSQLPKMFHKLYTSVKFSCQNRINGCPEELCYPDLRIHEQKCGFNTMTCPKQECGQQTYKKDFITHVSICNPTTECICGSTNQHDQQKCLRLQCETLKSQLNIIIISQISILKQKNYNQSKISKLHSPIPVPKNNLVEQQSINHLTWLHPLSHYKVYYNNQLKYQMMDDLIYLQNINYILNPQLQLYLLYILRRCNLFKKKPNFYEFLLRK